MLLDVSQSNMLLDVSQSNMLLDVSQSNMLLDVILLIFIKMYVQHAVGCQSVQHG